MSNPSYVKKYGVGNIKIDPVNTSFIYELPLLSFKDIQHTVNLGLVYNRQMKTDSETNPFNIAQGLKLNVQKRLIISDEETVTHLQDETGAKIELTKITEELYAFADSSQRILRRNVVTLEETLPGSGIIPDIQGELYEYTVEYPDYSKEKYNGLGKIEAVYDKYNGDTPYLSFAYTNGILTSVTYRGEKEITLQYTASKISKITYKADSETVCETDFVYGANSSITVQHYSGVDFELSLSENDFQSTSRNNGESENKEKLSCTFSEGIFTVSHLIGNKTVDTASYEIIHNYGYTAVYVQDNNGVKQKTVYKEDEPLYTHEIPSAGIEFVNNKYAGAVERYRIENAERNKNPLPAESHFDGEVMTYVDYKTWMSPISAPFGVKCYFILSGWIKTSSLLHTNPEICVSAPSGNTLCSFRIPLFKPEEWTYFAYQFSCPYEGHSPYVTVEDLNVQNDIYTSTGFKILCVPTHITPYENADETTLSDDVLIYNCASISLSDATFKKNGVAIEGVVYSSDLLRYFMNISKNINTNEFYTDCCKNIIITSASSVTVSNGTNEFNLINCKLGNIKGIKGHIRKNKYIFGSGTANVRLTVETSDEAQNREETVIATQQYDQNFDLISSTVRGITTSYTRTGKGLVTKETVSAGSTIIERTTVYDSSLKAVLSAKDEFGTETTYTTDNKWGAVTSYTVNSETVANQLDGDMCTLVSTSFAEGADARKTDFAYTDGNLSELAHGGISYQYGYDGLDLASVQKNNSQIEAHTYTKTSGNTTVASNYGSYSETAVLDKYGRLASIDGILSNTYDIHPIDYSDSLLLTGKDNGSSLLAVSTDNLAGKRKEYTYTYEGKELTRIKTLSSSSSSLVSDERFEYDSAGRVIKSSFADDEKAIELSCKYVLDGQDENDPSLHGNILGCEYKLNDTLVCSTENTYDALERISEKEHNFEGGAAFSKKITYNKTRASAVSYKKNGVTFDNEQYTYDALGRIASVGSVNYVYDSYGQLTQESNSVLDKKTVYMYNEIGCITSVTSSKIDGSNASTKTFTYDTAHPDRLTSCGGKAITYNTYGYPTSYNGWNWSWSKGRLSGISKGTRQTGINSYTYTYDAYGRRTQKRYSYLTAPGSLTPVTPLTVISSTTSYNYDSSDRLIYEQTTETLYNGTSTYREVTYLYDVNSVIGFIENYDSTVTTYYLNRNLQGDVTKIYDASGNLQCSYTYDAYGSCTVSGSNTSLGNRNAIRYRGYYFDNESELFCLGARYYSPEWRRFISPDDTSYIDPESVNGLNLYCYCNNDPINYADPSGHAPWWSWALSGLQLLGGIGLCFVPGLQGLGISMAIGGAAGLVMNVLEPQIAQFIGGADSVLNGYGAFSAGTSLLGFGGWITVAGVGLMAIGGATMLFGVNEIVDAVTGTNYIQQWAGMSDAAYAWSYLGLNLASSAGSGFAQRYIQTKTRTVMYNSDGSVKKYRYYKNGNKLYDVDFNHNAYGKAKINFPHYHGWRSNGERVDKHQKYIELIIWLLLGGR